MSCKILLVNDSSLVRQLVTNLFANEPGVKIQAQASNGELALKQLQQQSFDLVLLDFEMPVMDGLQTLDHLRQHYPDLPVIMLSRFTYQGAKVTVEALLRGALDYQTLPDRAAVDSESAQQLKQELLDKIQRLQPVKRITQPLNYSAGQSTRRQQTLALIAIGTSTGGPRVLEQLLSALPADLAIPIVIVQHIEPSFVGSLADSLNRKCLLPVGLAQHQQLLEPGIWLAPGERHLSLQKSEQQVSFELINTPAENSCKPAVDVLFRSVAEIYGPAALGIVLTGMGYDGLNGARAIRQHGGHVWIQDPDSSTIWGMPGAVAQANLADKVLAPEQMAHEIIFRLQGTAQRSESR